ncbi:MAG: hypothetical protein HC933_09290 [Pleurocapsa sp. SU_196_0]|nr:hypothetical protein [Pleurocapsa sp. SU_196_0]
MPPMRFPNPDSRFPIPDSPVRGRFAPSPTGEMHLGNLRTALLAWLQVREVGGVFVLRLEDLDVGRVRVGAADAILRDLEWLGLDWDEGWTWAVRTRRTYSPSARVCTKPLLHVSRRTRVPARDARCWKPRVRRMARSRITLGCVATARRIRVVPRRCGS